MQLIIWSWEVLVVFYIFAKDGWMANTPQRAWGRDAEGWEKSRRESRRMYIFFFCLSNQIRLSPGSGMQKPRVQGAGTVVFFRGLWEESVLGLSSSVFWLPRQPQHSLASGEFPAYPTLTVPDIPWEGVAVHRFPLLWGHCYKDYWFRTQCGDLNFINYIYHWPHSYKKRWHADLLVLGASKYWFGRKHTSTYNKQSMQNSIYLEMEGLTWHLF